MHHPSRRNKDLAHSSVREQRSRRVRCALRARILHKKPHENPLFQPRDLCSFSLSTFSPAAGVSSAACLQSSSFVSARCTATTTCFFALAEVCWCPCFAQTRPDCPNAHDVTLSLMPARCAMCCLSTRVCSQIQHSAATCNDEALPAAAVHVGGWVRVVCSSSSRRVQRGEHLFRHLVMLHGRQPSADGSCACSRPPQRRVGVQAHSWRGARRSWLSRAWYSRDGVQMCGRSRP